MSSNLEVSIYKEEIKKFKNNINKLNDLYKNNLYMDLKNLNHIEINKILNLNITLRETIKIFK